MFCRSDDQILINAETVHVGPSTKMDGNPTNQAQLSLEAP